METNYFAIPSRSGPSFTGGRAYLIRRFEGHKDSLGVVRCNNGFDRSISRETALCPHLPPSGRPYYRREEMGTMHVVLALRGDCAACGQTGRVIPDVLSGTAEPLCIGCFEEAHADVPRCSGCHCTLGARDSRPLCSRCRDLDREEAWQ